MNPYCMMALFEACMLTLEVELRGWGKVILALGQHGYIEKKGFDWTNKKIVSISPLSSTK